MDETVTNEKYPEMEWPTALDIPLKASEELVSIDLETDLPEDPNDLRTLLVEENSDKEHWLTIAAAYCNQEKIEEGIKLATMGLEVFEGANKASLHTFLSWAYLKRAKENQHNPEQRNKDLAEVENHLKESISIDPTWVGNMLATVDLYYQRGHYDKALETSDLFVKGIQAEERRTGKSLRPNCMFLLMRAKLLYQMKNYAASLKLFQELLVTNPVLKPDPRLGIGMCFWQLKDYKMATTSWERALALNPSNTDASILVLLGKFHNSIAVAQNDIEFTEKITAALTDLNNLFKDEQNKENPVLLTLLQSYFYLQKNYQKVINIYERKILPRESMIANPIMSESAFWCARAHYALNDHKKSFIMFQESLKRNEDNLLARFGVGQAQLKSDLVEESIITFENLYKSHENIQEINYILGLLYASKCLNSRDESASTKETLKLNEKAIQFLEKYIKLTTAKKNQLVIPRAYLVISQLYDKQSKYKQSLDALTKVLEELNVIDPSEIPVEIFNNLGCFYFISGDLTKSMEFFEKAKSKAIGNKSLEISIDFNIARTDESNDLNKSQTVYETIASAHPNYIAARVRNLYCKFIKNQDIESDIKEVLNKFNSNPEVRSFYSWYLKKSHKETMETSHDRETLVKYDSHDVFALISLANLYVVIAKDTRKSSNPKEQDKSKHSYLKAIQLYQKVLQVDPLNVYAAQGIAIIFAESKRLGPALEILRKVRDSINNEDVHLNLSNCLLEMNEYSKAIENYEILLKKFDNLSNKSYIHSLLGRAWYARGMKEKSVEHLNKSLINTTLALEEESKAEKKNIKFVASLKYNTALLQFQIAETLRRANVQDRTLAALKEALVSLTSGLDLLKEIKDIEEFNIIPKEEIEQRIQLGETTMKNALERCITEQEAYEEEQEIKLSKARKLLEENEQKEKERIAKEEEEKRIEMEKKAEEFRRLQDEAQKLIQERDANIVNEDDVDFAEEEEGKKKRRKNTEGGKRKKAKASKKEADILDDEEEEQPPSGDDNDEDEDAVIRTKGKKSALSNEFISDSDESSAGEDDGLF